MALFAFWKSNRDTVLGLTIQQILSSCGDGHLRDDSECSNELRQFLHAVPSEYLICFIQYCLDSSFDNSGLVLQDLVNEVGRRLEFEVEDGLYRGKKNTIGFDGIWRSADIPDILIEVKTTDYVTIPLEKIVAYKKALVSEGRISSDASFLIVVGREDTGALEAQIRGSRYAWEMRLISADRLSTLLQIKEKSSEDTTIRQIKELLQPFEYTKIDKIIDVIFAASEDVEKQEIIEEPQGEAIHDVEPKQIHTDRDLLNDKRQFAFSAFSRKLKMEFIKHRQTLFWNVDKSVRLCVAVSKRYERDYQAYWYAYHDVQNEFLKEGVESYLILACMDKDVIYAIPYKEILNNMENLNRTVKPDGSFHYHIALGYDDQEKITWHMSKIGKKVPLEEYALQLR